MKMALPGWLAMGGISIPRDAKSFCSPLTAMRALIARATVCSVLKAVVRYSSLMRRVTGSTVTVGRLRVPSLLVVRHPPVVAWVVTWCLFPQFRHRSDPARRVEWEIRRSRAIEELTRLQMKLIEDPNSAAIKHNIQSQQNIINTCNEMIAIYQ